MFIIPLLQGRTGNQMFQIAAAKAYSLTYDKELKIPNVTKDMNVWQPSFKGNTKGQEPTHHLYKEKSFRYDPIPYVGRHENLTIEGFFQSYKYFIQFLPEIKKMFSELTGYTVKKIPATAIHIRRGDYLKYPDTHPAVTSGYIKNALEAAKFDDISKPLYIFSDDKDWCKEYFKDFKFKVFIGSGNDIEDMYIMASCEKIIISNSSYSYWAAMLSDNSEIFCPCYFDWFGEGCHHDTSDLLPEEWKQILRSRL